MAVAASFRSSAVPQSVHDPVSHPRASNRTCRFPASGSPTGSRKGSRWSPQMHPPKPQDPQFAEDRTVIEAAGAPRGHLVAAPPSPSRIASSAGSGSSLELKDSRQSPDPRPLRRHPEVRPRPSTVVTGFVGTMGLSDSRLGSPALPASTVATCRPKRVSHVAQ